MFTSLKLPELNQVTISDSLWSKYTKMVSDIIIPYQWKILNDQVEEAEQSHCLENFRIAAGEIEGNHKGAVFVDTDVYKWLESVAYCVHNGTGKQYESIADEVVELIGRAQQSDGYLNTYYTVAEPNARWTNLLEGHELYSAGHLIEAAVAYHKATGKNKLLNIACRFADLICKVFGYEEGQIKGYPGHQEIELALVKLYRVTKEVRYLECAKYFLDERGSKPSYFEKEIKERDNKMLFDEFKNYDLKYSQSHMPVKQQTTAEGHAVRATYMYCAMADIALEYKDDEMLSACKSLWQNITQRRMYITGGIGSSGLLERFTTDYHLPNSSGYCETCASIGLALFSRRMFMIEKDARYYEAVERTLYNTILAGISEDGEHYFYVNPLEVWPEACLDATSLSHVKPVRQRWFDVACCPTNLARTLASLGDYIYSQSEDTIFVNLYISSTLNANVDGNKVQLVMDSNLMQDGKIVIKVKVKNGNKITLAVRIPEYANNPTFKINGIAVESETNRGYAYLDVSDDEYTLELDLHVKAKWISSNLNVRENVGKVALVKGPCVYCLEEVDNGKNLPSIFVNSNAEIQDSENNMLSGGLNALVYKGSRLIEEDDNQLYKDAQLRGEPVTVKAIPYGIWGDRNPGEMQVWVKVKF